MRCEKLPKISNTQVFGLDESIYRSGYPMLSQAPDEEEFVVNVERIKQARLNDDFTNSHIKRAVSLAQAKGGGHDQFLTGITVTADFTLSNKCWVEAERYKFLCFVSSMSTMQRVSLFKIGDCCNEFADENAVKVAEDLQAAYNDIDGQKESKEKERAYLKLLYNLPSGFELMAGIVTNYRCLKNIRAQRRHHRLPDWQIICDWIEQLPLANELIVGGISTE